VDGQERERSESLLHAVVILSLVACCLCYLLRERGAASRKLRASACKTESGSSVSARLFAVSMLTVAYLCMCAVAARLFPGWNRVRERKVHVGPLVFF
jgi:hypothetical protein